ncbi:Protein of unknown function [Pyronema omphalodes CBS 100304]|uniref:Uncharacterized protein n=1 Tax=Pyronema omphalodes (strain CBS 100304) TaxID=1076935 RepID=U4LTK9_PYROM|nr:Protein of unknown function [Pyronema omphalodes CBS 100304]
MRPILYSSLIFAFWSKVCVIGCSDDFVSRPFDYDLIINCENIEQCSAIDMVYFDSVSIVPTSSLVCDNGFQSISEQFVGNNTGSNPPGSTVDDKSASPSPSEGQKKNAGVINVVS